MSNLKWKGEKPLILSWHPKSLRQTTCLYTMNTIAKIQLRDNRRKRAVFKLHSALSQLVSTGHLCILGVLTLTQPSEEYRFDILHIDYSNIRCLYFTSNYKEWLMVVRSIRKVIAIQDIKRYLKRYLLIWSSQFLSWKWKTLR